MTTTTHGPLYYRLLDDQFVYTCDCGWATEPYVMFEHALTALELHLRAKGGESE